MSEELIRILKEAISMEEESCELYLTAQKKAKLSSSKSFLKELAETELEHKKKLAGMISNKTQILTLGNQRGKSLEDLRIVDYMKDVASLSEDANYQEILTYAAQREKRTHDYYTSLAKKFQGTRVGELFQMLAEEELKHKIKIEEEYDNTFLKDN
jgi:rubrerythrin